MCGSEREREKDIERMLNGRREVRENFPLYIERGGNGDKNVREVAISFSQGKRA